jgi:hypothetical protein
MISPVADLLERLHSRGVELIMAGDRLRYRPVEALTNTELAELRRHKAEVLRIISYRSALRQFWHLAAVGADADPVDATTIHNEIVRLVDEIGERLATTLRQRWEMEWHQETGRCPRCGVQGHK